MCLGVIMKAGILNKMVPSLILTYFYSFIKMSLLFNIPTTAQGGKNHLSADVCRSWLDDMDERD